MSGLEGGGGLPPGVVEEGSPETTPVSPELCYILPWVFFCWGQGFLGGRGGDPSFCVLADGFVPSPPFSNFTPPLPPNLADTLSLFHNLCFYMVTFMRKIKT